MEINNFYMNILRRREPADEILPRQKYFSSFFVFHFRPFISQSEQYQKHKQRFLIFSDFHMEIVIYI